MSGEFSIVTVTLNPAIDRTLTIDGFAVGKVNRVIAEQSHAAGKGVNVATMLADLAPSEGERVVVTGFLGADNARPFEELFASCRMNDQFIRVHGSTRVGIKIVDHGQTTDINFPGRAPTAGETETLLSRIDSLAGPNRWFVLCGSVPAGMDLDIYAQLIDRIHAVGGKILLDTSGAPLGPALARSPDVVKPNIAELSEWIGHPLSSAEEVATAARQRLIERGVKIAVVSMGADGAVFIDQDRALLAIPPNVQVRSTVGAGDVMVAGIVFGQSKGWSLERTAVLASSLGTYAVTRIGVGLESPEAYRNFESELVVLGSDLNCS